MAREVFGRKEHKERKGWKRVRLGELVDNNTISIGRGNVISKETIAASPGTYPVFSSSATGDGIIGYYSKFMFDDERLSWSIDGGGRFFYHPKSRYSVTNVSGWIKVNKPFEITPRFLYVALDAEWQKKHFDYQTKAHPSVIKNEYTISYPPLEDQNRITATITACENNIVALQSLIAKYEAIKKATVNLLLKPKADWQRVKLGEVCELTTCTIPTECIDQQYYVGTENMLQNCQGVVPNLLPIPYKRVRAFAVNDILISNIRPYLKKIWLADKNGGCSSDVNVVHCTSCEICSAYICHVLSQDRFFDFVMANAIGTKMPRGDKSIIKAFEFYYPYSAAEQRMITNEIAAIDNAIAAYKIQLEKVRQLKQGMMSYFFG